MITEFNNCFILRSPSLLSYFNQSLAAQGKRSTIFLFRMWFQLRMSRVLPICSKTRLDGTMHEQTIICRQLFAGHVVDSHPIEGKEKTHRMITLISHLYGAKWSTLQKLIPVSLTLSDWEYFYYYSGWDASPLQG